MKNLLLPTFLFTLLFQFSFQSNTSAQCQGSTAQTDLDVNNVKARLQVSGGLWWDGSEGVYIVPKPEVGEPEVSAIFAGGIWMGGLSDSGNLKFAGQTYGTGSQVDYFPGPLDDNGVTTDDDCANYDQFWTTTSTDINMHIEDLNDNGVIDGPVPNSVLGWPGRGNPNFFGIYGFELPYNGYGMAPFFDYNNNGFYDPMNGDYPDINGASLGTWWVFNDAGNIHTQTGGAPLNMEIQVLAYAYNSANDHINNATYYDYRFISKATEVIDSIYIGLWVDFDLGCPIDDYLGCDTLNDLAYVYNSDALDGLSNCNDCLGGNTYCEDIPIVGIKMLEGVKDIENNEVIDRGMSSFMYYNNAGTNPPPVPGTTDPSTAPQYYNYLTGSWADGTRLTYGGDGYNLGGEHTNYAFPDSPSDVNGWSMCNEGLSDGDRRAVISSGPYTALPGAINTLSFAVVYADGIEYPCPEIDPLIEAGNDVQDVFDGVLSSIEELATVPANILFQPNPMEHQGTLIFKDLENEVQQVGVFSIDGRELRNYTNINGSSLTIEKGNLSPGIYFYKLLTDDFKIHSGKFIVQ